MKETWVTMTEACKILGISQSTLYRRVKKGEIESKKEDNATMCLVSVSNESQDDTMDTQELLSQLRGEVEYLRNELTQKESQTEEARKAAVEASQRHDTIVLQLTRQLENQQRLLEHQQEPWYRRWCRKRRTPEGE